MTNVKSFYDAINIQSSENILICMATNMEVSWDFFNTKGSYDSTSSFGEKSLFRNFILFCLIELF